jgi:hypothetical protein
MTPPLFSSSARQRWIITFTGFAVQHSRKGMCTVHVLVDTDSSLILGYHEPVQPIEVDAQPADAGPKERAALPCSPVFGSGAVGLVSSPRPGFGQVLLMAVLC